MKGNNVRSAHLAGLFVGCCLNPLGERVIELDCFEPNRLTSAKANEWHCERHVWTETKRGALSYAQLMDGDRNSRMELEIHSYVERPKKDDEFFQ